MYSRTTKPAPFGEMFTCRAKRSPNTFSLRPAGCPRGRWGAPFARFGRVAFLLAVTAPPAALRCSSPPEGRPNHQVLWPVPVPARHNLDG